MKNVGAVSYHFKIRIRDGRYKYEITRIRYETQSYYDVTKWYDKNQINSLQRNVSKYFPALPALWRSSWRPQPSNRRRRGDRIRPERDR